MEEILWHRLSPLMMTANVKCARTVSCCQRQSSYTSAKLNNRALADDLTSEPLTLVDLGVCSSKNYPYRGQSEKCPGKTAISSLCEQLEKLAHITYFCLVRERNVVKKKQEATGKEMAAMLEDLVIGTKMRYASCIYNIYIPLILWVQAPKNFLKENEVILSVDISKNYQNKQCHKIQNAFFGHENFTLFTAASYFHRQLSILKASPAILRQLSILRASCLVIVPVAVVSNETSQS